MQCLNNICQKDEFADVTFIVEDIKIPAHKTILSARSSYFNAMFQPGGFKEANQTEIELNVPLNAFRVILKYIYTGWMSFADLECTEIIELYDLANQYGFDSLQKAILHYLEANLTLENCVTILNAAQRYAIDHLQNWCLMFMDINPTDLLERDTFKELSMGSLCALLKRDTFCAPENKIFNAICNWHTRNPSSDIKVNTD